MGIAPTTTEEDNKNIYYDNNDNITQQHCDQINLLGRQREKIVNFATIR